MVAARTDLAARGFIVMTFNYAYTEAGRKAPDRLPKLIDVHSAAAQRLASYADSVVLAGKSMGGRVGGHVVPARTRHRLLDVDPAHRDCPQASA